MAKASGNAGLFGNSLHIHLSEDGQKGCLHAASYPLCSWTPSLEILMFSKKSASGITPLRSAFLCVDCESISNRRFDVCPVCGSHSLLSLARTLGGTLFAGEGRRPASTPFNSQIVIRLPQMEASDFSFVLEAIGSVIESSPVRGRASVHVNVEPASDVDALQRAA
jgi:hypothetical protein